MKSAEGFIEALEQGVSTVEALQSLPEYKPRYIRKVPVEVYRAALRNGWRVFPVSSSEHLAVTPADIFAATDNSPQLKHCARESPTWVLATGPDSGVLALVIDGGEGLASLLDLCGDDWSWLDTLRSVAGERRCLFFAWPEGRRQISNRRQMGEGLSVFGEGHWALIPPSRDPHGAQHAYLNATAAVGAAPAWLLTRAFELADTVDPSRPLPPCSAVLDACSSAVLAEHAHD